MTSPEVKIVKIYLKFFISNFRCFTIRKTNVHLILTIIKITIFNKEKFENRKLMYFSIHPIFIRRLLFMIDIVQKFFIKCFLF